MKEQLTATNTIYNMVSQLYHVHISGVIWTNVYYIHYYTLYMI